jgi:hypothetical protein
MQHAKLEIVEETLALWQPRSARTLVADDARQMLDNSCGFFGLLAEWMRAEQPDQDKTEQIAFVQGRVRNSTP